MDDIQSERRFTEYIQGIKFEILLIYPIHDGSSSNRRSNSVTP